MHKLTIIVAVVMCLYVSTLTANAAEVQSPVIETANSFNLDTIRASDPPDAFYDLNGSDNYYEATLIDLAANRGSYTRYYFATGTGNIYLKFDFEHSGTTTDKNRYLIVYVYQKDTKNSSGKLYDTISFNFSDEDGTIYKSITGLDKDKYYYFRFFNNTSTDTGSGKDISATIIIDDKFNS